MHATREEALEETHRMLGVYADFARQYMAMPVFLGEKTESERFPGADTTLCIESMMQDRKALQAGTSHFLGQNFARASNIKFLDEQGEERYAWTTSWGSSTRLIGGLIMMHSDDDGLVLPPRLAAAHVVILPILHKEESRAQVLAYCEQLRQALREIQYDGRPIEVELDMRDLRGGDKMWQWVKKGVPIRLEVGPKDIAADSVFMGRRDKSTKERVSMKREAFLGAVVQQLEEMQAELLQRAEAFIKEHTAKIDKKEDFYSFFTPKNKAKPEIHGGFAYSHWNGDPAVEEQIKRDLKVTIRCVPFEDEKEEGKCVITGEPSKQRVYFAKSY